ncbi:MAG TPA: response regulator [Verrucomicrobiae bacterium]|nr:response regulator [Verrucomicrobiae bacterium]
MFLKNRSRKVGKLLVVDDDATIRTLVEALLRKINVPFRSVVNGEQAVHAWEEETFAMILMDVQMPEMDGLQATQEIREKEKERGGHTPIVAMTAYAVPGDDERCRAAGMDEYMTKPIDFNRFYSLIERFATSQDNGKDIPAQQKFAG